MQEEAMLNLRWDLFSSQLATTLDTCYEKQYFVDLSLVCRDGTTIKCHKMVLANSSTFFRRILVKNDHPHPMIVLHDIEADDLKTIVNFMYCGEIEVLKSEVRRLLKIAEILEISGLKDIRSSAQFQKTYAAQLAPFSDNNSDDNKTRKIDSPTSQCKPYYFREKSQEIIKNNNKNGDKHNDDSKKMSSQITGTLSPQENSGDSNDGNRINFRGDLKETQGQDKSHQKRGSSENCQYLKKLRLLGEIDIICRSNSDEKSPNRQSEESEAIHSELEQRNNYGVFIKDEIDIPFDVGNLEAIGNITKIKKKLFSNPGIEIFKAQPKRFSESMPGPSRGESLSPRSRNSIDSF